MEGFRIDLKTFWAWLCLTNTLKVLESKYQTGFGMIISSQNPLTFMIPILYIVPLHYMISMNECSMNFLLSSSNILLSVDFKVSIIIIFLNIYDRISENQT